jgi:hypothetical protein
MRSNSAWSQSFPRLTSIKTLQREQDLTSLAPKRGLVAAQAVEGVGRQVGEAHKGAREIVRLLSCLHGRPRTNNETGGLIFILPLSSSVPTAPRQMGLVVLRLFGRRGTR